MRTWTLAALAVVAAAPTSCVIPTRGIEPTVQVLDPLPADLSAYRVLGVRVDGSHVPDAQVEVERFAEELVARLRSSREFAGALRSIVPDARVDLELAVEVLRVQRVTQAQRFFGPGGIAGFHTRVSVRDLRTGSVLGAGLCSAQGTPGTTDGAIDLAVRAVVRFMTGDAETERGSSNKEER